MTKLPGVGRKTASVVLGHAYDIAEGIAVDTHVLRVTNRLGIARADDPLEVERQLMAIIPRRALDAHHRPPDLPRPQDLHRAAPAVRRVPGLRPLPLAVPPGVRDGRDAAGAAAGPPRPAQAHGGAAVSRRLVVAAAQMTSTADVERNLAIAESLIAQAAARGAALAAPAGELRLPAQRGRAGPGAAGPRRPVGAPHGRGRAPPSPGRSCSAASPSASPATRASTTPRSSSDRTARRSPSTARSTCSTSTCRAWST